MNNRKQPFSFFDEKKNGCFFLLAALREPAKWFLGFRQDILYCEYFVIYRKMNIESCKSHTLNASRVVLIRRPGIESQSLKKSGAFLRRKRSKQGFVTLNRKTMFDGRVRKRAAGFRMTVRKRQIRFNIKDWCAVHQVSTGYI